MKRLNPLEFQTGFLMGAIFGLVLEIALIFIYNHLIRNWLGWNVLDLAWWFLIPIPLIFGIIMGFNIANLHLEDY